MLQTQCATSVPEMPRAADRTTATMPRRRQVSSGNHMTLQALQVVFAVAAVCSFGVNAQAVQVTVRVANLAPQEGLYLTPVWAAFHDGTFDVFDAGMATAADGGLERAAEDGDFAALRSEFAASPAAAAGGVDGMVFAPAGFPGAPVFDPGDSGTISFDLDPVKNRYFSYVSMVIPSNDAFIGNDAPTAIEIFDDAGNFVGPVSFQILGTQVWDAGTEANTEMDAAFFDQTAPNSGVTTAEPVSLHAGFNGSVGNPAGMSHILGGVSTAPPGIFFDSTAADFTQSDYVLAQISIVPVPEPTTAGLLFAGLAAGLVCLATRCGMSRRRRMPAHS